MEIELQAGPHEKLIIKDDDENKVYAIVKLSTKQQGWEHITILKSDLLAAIQAICRKK